MHRIIAALVAFVFASSAFAADLDDKNYAGDDAGVLVMAMSHAKSGVEIDRLFLNFRKLDRSDTGYVEYLMPKVLFGVSLTSTSRDFTTEEETGIVFVRSLPPGDYEFFQSTALHGEFLTRVRYSLPFTIKARETTYLGGIPGLR